MSEPCIDESNFLDLYLTAVGRTEIPEQFHTWVALSLVAACLENRVWFNRMAYQNIYPNLYVFLIGDPACGKGTAINLGKRVLDACERQGYGLQYYRGALTRAAMQDELAQRWCEARKAFDGAIFRGELAEEPTGVSLYTLAPELSANVSVGPVAKDMIKFLTDLWEGDIGYYQERTRGQGKHAFNNPCLNLLAGSAPEWCREVVDAKDLASGFWARVACVLGERNYGARIARPDTRYWTTLLPVLCWRLGMLMGTAKKDDIAFRGPMVLSPEADALDIEWYETRPRPVDHLFAAHWGRQPDQIIRLAMLLKFCDFFDLETCGDNESWRVIEARHWHKARELSDVLLRNAGTFLGDALALTYNAKMMFVEMFVRQRVEVQQKPDLLRLVGRQGLKSLDLEKALQGLEDEEKVERVPLGRGNFLVRWTGEG